jgi:3-oxoacyl-[acyl-carrier protein] reductase
MPEISVAPSVRSDLPPGRLLDDLVVIVTGGSRGIGRAIVKELISQGARVAFTYQSREDAARSLIKELECDDERLLTFQADVRDLASGQRIVAKTIEHFGRLDGLVNNAGIVRDRALMLMTPNDWQDVLETNLTGIFNCCRSAIVTMLKQHSGRIVNITSVSGLIGMAGQVNYSASKAGIVGLTKALAREVAGYNITVNAIAPGLIQTEMTEAIDEKRRAELQAQIPLGRFGQPQEVAQIVAVLLSKIGSYITGQVITIDGGLAI